MLLASAKDAYYPTLAQYTDSTAETFQQWLRRWHLNKSLLNNWKAFVREKWPEHNKHIQDRWSSDTATQCQRRFSGLVVHCADHYPDLIHVFCPIQYYKQLLSTFQDQTVFRALPDDPIEFSKLIFKHMDQDLRARYKWGFDIQVKFLEHMSYSKARRIGRPHGPSLHLQAQLSPDYGNA